MVKNHGGKDVENIETVKKTYLAFEKNRLKF
jgi:hypothetical protein